eukprot:3485221-Alexandrium_andersonii.AAC.1
MHGACAVPPCAARWTWWLCPGLVVLGVRARMALARPAWGRWSCALQLGRLVAECCHPLGATAL